MAICRIESRDLAGGCDCLGHRFSRIVFVKKRLPLQVAGFDIIPVEDAQCADAGAREQRGQNGTGGAASHDDDTRSLQFFLAVGSDSFKQNLPRVPVLHGGNIRVQPSQFQGDYLS